MKYTIRRRIFGKYWYLGDSDYCCEPLDNARLYNTLEEAVSRRNGSCGIQPDDELVAVEEVPGEPKQIIVELDGSQSLVGIEEFGFVRNGQDKATFLGYRTIRDAEKGRVISGLSLRDYRMVGIIYETGEPRRVVRPLVPGDPEEA